MIDQRTIFILAKKDVNTNSFPRRNKNNGNFIFSVGQKTILNDKSFEKLRENSRQINSLKDKREDLINTMLTKQSAFSTEQTNTDKKIKETKEDIKKLSIKIELLKEDISNEEKRLISRGFSLPDKNEMSDIKDEKTVKTGYFQNIKKNIVSIKKWVSVFIIIIVIETIFGIALWEMMRETKTTIQVILRIISSGLLVVTLHLAEIKYKEHNAKIFVGYIVYGILALIFLLFGSLALTYLYPDNQLVNDISGAFDLSNKRTYQIQNNNELGLVDFIKQYDFIIGIFSVIIYMFLSFLDKSKKVDKEIKEDKYINHSHTDESQIVYKQLNQFYKNLAEDERRLNSFQLKIEKLKETPSDLLLEISDLLEDKKRRIEEIDEKTDILMSSIGSIYRNIEQNLLQYKIDFTDEFKDKPAAGFVKLQWPNKDDIMKYYNIY